jgi:hypothetical protein
MHTLDLYLTAVCCTAAIAAFVAVYYITFHASMEHSMWTALKKGVGTQVRSQRDAHRGMMQLAGLAQQLCA